MEMVIEARSGYLSATATGDIGAGDFEPAFGRIFAACAEHGLRHVLVDCRAAAGLFSTFDRYRFGTLLADFYSRHIVGGARPVWFAFVCAEMMVEPQRLGETVAVNRGVNVKVTTDLAEALQFLAVAAPGADAPSARRPARAS